MNKKRLIMTSLLSIFLVSILLVGSTYSIFTSQEIDENTNIYKTGNLNITYTLSEDNIIFTNNIPMTEKEAEAIIPYRITVTNSGNVPYMFDLILNDNTSGNVIDYQYIMTRVGYLDSKSLSECNERIIAEDLILPAGESVDIDVRIWLSSKISSSEFGKSFYAKLAIDGLAVYNDNEQINNNILSLKYMKPLSSTDNDASSTNVYFRSDTYRGYIKTVSFVDYINTSNAIEVWDMSDTELSSENSVVAWIENNEATGYYNLYIGANYEIYAQNLYNFLSGMHSLTNVSFKNLNTSYVTNMSNMFYNCRSLTTLDLSNFNTNNVTNMSRMFSNCSSLTTLDLSNFNTNNVTNMSSMFSFCSNLTTLDLSNFNTNNVTNMYSMFDTCSSLTALDLSNFNTSNVEDMSMMFYRCSSLTTTLTIKNPTVTYFDILASAATKTGAKITLNYNYRTSYIVDSMLATATSNSNVSKGELVK